MPTKTYKYHAPCPDQADRSLCGIHPGPHQPVLIDSSLVTCGACLNVLKRREVVRIKRQREQARESLNRSNYV